MNAVYSLLHGSAVQVVLRVLGAVQQVPAEDEVEVDPEPVCHFADQVQSGGGMKSYGYGFHIAIFADYVYLVQPGEGKSNS